MSRRERQRRSPVRIELTALVDVVLLLLIFFMVSARLVPDFAFELELPRAQSASEIEFEAEDLRIAVDAEDRYFLSGEAASMAVLEARFLEARETRVVLDADKAASHGAVMRVLDAAKSAGIESVQIAADAQAAAD